MLITLDLYRAFSIPSWACQMEEELCVHRFQEQVLSFTTRCMFFLALLDFFRQSYWYLEYRKPSSLIHWSNDFSPKPPHGSTPNFTEKFLSTISIDDVLTVLKQFEVLIFFWIFFNFLTQDYHEYNYGNKTFKRLLRWNRKSECSYQSLRTPIRSLSTNDWF